MTNENKTAWDTKSFVVCETNLGKLRSELKAAQERIAVLEAALIKVFNEKIPLHVADIIEKSLGDVK